MFRRVVVSSAGIHLQTWLAGLKVGVEPGEKGAHLP